MNEHWMIAGATAFKDTLTFAAANHDQRPERAEIIAMF